MIIKKTSIIKNQILMIGLSDMYSMTMTHNNGIDYDVRYQYKIFVFDMIPDKTDLAGNPIQGFDAISPNFQELDYVNKNGLHEHEFKKMFTLDWDFLQKTWGE